MKGIFYNSQKAVCSIYESGQQIYDILKKSTFFELDYTEDRKFQYEYDFCIVNYHFTTNNWIRKEVLDNFKGPSFCIVTEVSFSENVLELSPKYFTHYIVLDPTIKEYDNIYGFGRPIKSNYKLIQCSSKIPIISSFGLATPGKDWLQIIKCVASEFNEAIIRFNIPIGTHNKDTHNIIIKELKENIDKLNLKPSIKFQLTHLVMTEKDLVEWLSESTINCFFYFREHIYKAGLAAVTDQAIMAERPILITKDITFRHLHKYIDYYPNINISEAIIKTQEGVKKMKDNWSENNFLKKFENILLH